MTRVRILLFVVALLLAVLFGLAWNRYGDVAEFYIFQPDEPPASQSLTVPEGFSIAVFAKNLPGARVLREDALGNLWVSQTSKGIVALVELDERRNARRASPIFTGLASPHGLALDPRNPYRLYIAEEGRVSSVAVYSEDELRLVIGNLPTGEGHSTRTIGFGPDGMLYISAGSSCNVCRESNEYRAAILQSDPEGKAVRVYAKGLRNAVFFTWRDDGKMFATEMGRDLLGDDTPPDEIDVIEQNKNYGWPICYGKNIHDTDFDKNTHIRNPCMAPFETPSFIDIQAHSAPLGLAFIPKDSAWPREYWHDLLVAYHGSWNRSTKTGYKIVRYYFDDSGNYEGVVEDFAIGWLMGDAVSGRPVDILVKPDGVAYVSDDHAGVIYKIEYMNK